MTKDHQTAELTQLQEGEHSQQIKRQITNLGKRRQLLKLLMSILRETKCISPIKQEQSTMKKHQLKDEKEFMERKKMYACQQICLKSY